MGVKYSSSESSALMEAMTNNIVVANTISDRLSTGCDHLIASLDSGQLQGAAYTAGRGLFSDVIIPAITKVRMAVEDIQSELQSYKTANELVSKYGNLDLDELKDLKKQREKMLKLVNEQISEHDSFLNSAKDFVTFDWGSHMETSRILSDTKQNLEAGISSVNEKIDALELFVSQVSSYFSDSLAVLQLAIQGAVQLSQVVVDAEGHYYTDGLDMTWSERMKELKLVTATSSLSDLSAEDATFAQNLMTQYGFDEKTAREIIKVRDGIDQNFPDKTQKEKDYIFTLTMGSFVYHEDTDGRKNFMWKQTAGELSDATGWEVEDASELLKKLDLDEREIKKLRYEIRLQHSLVVGGEKVESLKPRIRQSALDHYKKVYGTEKGFETYYNQKLKDYSGDGKISNADFAHQMITTATILRPQSSPADLYGGKSHLENLAGWLGDTTSEADASPSIGNDDYRADLDSVNITARMKKSGISYIEASNQYYSDIVILNQNQK